MRRERDAERLKTRQKKEEEAAKEQQQLQQPNKAAAEKIIAQWRKAVPFAPNKNQSVLPQTLAKEAVDKRRHHHPGNLSKSISN